MDEDQIALGKLLNCSPEFIKRFCYEKLELAPTSKISYIKDFEYFINWLFEFRNKPRKELSLISMSFINNLSKDDIEQYVQFLRDKGMKSMKRKVYSLRSIFSFLLFTKDEAGDYLLKHNEFIKVLRVEQERNQITRKHEIDETREEIMCFVEFVYQGYIPVNSYDEIFYKSNRLRDASIVALIADTGLRLSEIRFLNCKDLDLSKNHVSFLRRNYRGPGKHFVQISFGEKAKSILLEYVRVDFDNDLVSNLPLFFTRGRNSKGSRLTRRALALIIEKYADAFGKSVITANRIRQTFILDYLDSNNISTGEMQLGLSITDMIGVYSKYNDFGI
ncbi:tyrosine-type recombinase/integrase [Cohnella candidum]|nr:tyrosine-type recombinase/integrase [Cohnella candidum]